MRILKLSLIFILIFAINVSGDEEYSFDLTSIQKRALTFNGYLEFRPVFSKLNMDSRPYYLNFFNNEEISSISDYNLSALINLNYEKGSFGVVTTSNLLISKNYEGWDNKFSLYEAYISIKPSHSISFSIGKKRLKWGKGYAWNPVAFADRPKNPNDPELAMEGFIVFTFEYIKSFKGILKTLSISPVILPVNENINSEFGDKNDIIFGGKIYLLLADTDIDIIFLSGKNFAERFGIDFSRNLSSNIEVHGEISYTSDIIHKKKLNYLFGTRFLTRSEITFILEYYINGMGISSDEMENYFTEIQEAYNVYLLTGEETILNSIKYTTDTEFRSFAPMRDYLYFRMSRKEPFNILYFTPSLTSIYNLVDHSFSITPEFIYAPVTNLELRAKITLFSGRAGSDFGEKQNNFRLEFRGRFYF